MKQRNMFHVIIHYFWQVNQDIYFVHIIVHISGHFKTINYQEIFFSPDIRISVDQKFTYNTQTGSLQKFHHHDVGCFPGKAAGTLPKIDNIMRKKGGLSRKYIYFLKPQDINQKCKTWSQLGLPATQ